MIGQDVLLSKLSESVPKSFILEGEEGCGKHLLAQHVSELINKDIYDITDVLTLETIEECRLTTIPYLYLINCKDISIREQNVILKFLEEPPKISNIVLLVENRITLLETVVNRCVPFTFVEYTDEELLQICGNECKNVIEYVRTPGKIIQLSQVNLEEVTKLSKSILCNIGKASYSNVLSIMNNFVKDSQGVVKLQLETFSIVFQKVSYDLYREGLISWDELDLVIKLFQKLNVPKVDKLKVFELFLLDLRGLF